FEIVACADRNPPKAQHFASECGIQALSADELIAEANIDVVLNLTPPVAHAPIALQAFAAGKHVFTEKPLAASVDEATEMLRDADQRGVRIGCAPDIFLGSAYEKARRLIQ